MILEFSLTGIHIWRGEFESWLEVRIDPGQDVLVVKSHIQNAKDSNENGRDVDEDGKEKGKLVVNSKINRAKNSLVVESHVDGAKDSNINLGDEKLVLNSKINRAKNSLVVESHVEWTEDRFDEQQWWKAFWKFIVYFCWNNINSYSNVFTCIILSKYPF